MSRAGRKRMQDRGRYPNGQVKPDPQQREDRVPPAIIGRLNSETLKLLFDPKMATQVGQLTAIGVLSNAQAATANRLGDIYRRYYRLKQLKWSPKTASWEVGFGGDADLAEERMSDDQLEAFEDQVRSAERAWKEIETFFERGQINKVTKKYMIDLCVHDLIIPRGMMTAVRVVLDAVTQVWGPEWKRQLAKPQKQLRQGGANLALLRTEVARERKTAVEVLAVDFAVRAIKPDATADELQKARECWRTYVDRERERARSARR